MSVWAVGSRSSRSSAWPTTSTLAVAPASASVEIERDRHAAPHFDVALERLESLRLDREVIGIRRQVAEDVTCRRHRWSPCA